MSVCTRRSELTEMYASPCPECRHTNLVHPNSGNPELAECILCVLAARIDQVTDASRVTVQPGYTARILPGREMFDDGSIRAVVEMRRQ